jgi:uncharacterized protein YbaA (DUF1428 family)
MKPYVDGFLIAVPKKNAAVYKKIADYCNRIWMEHGALAATESQSDDVQVGALTSFPRAVLLKPNEDVWFSFIVYKSKADRNRINKLVMSDPRMQTWMREFQKSCPFDGMRMIWGGFQSHVHYTKDTKYTKAARFDMASIQGKFEPVKPSKDPTAKLSETKKAISKKVASKKTVSKKTAAKKPVVKKLVEKKTSAKKTIVKKKSSKK